MPSSPPSRSISPFLHNVYVKFGKKDIATTLRPLDERADALLNEQELIRR